MNYPVKKTKTTDDDLETDPLEHEDEMYRNEDIIPVEWKLLKLGDSRLRISNEGKIHFLDISMFYVTAGNRETGTPYRYVDVQVFKGEIRSILCPRSSLANISPRKSPSRLGCPSRKPYTHRYRSLLREPPSISRYLSRYRMYRV